MSDVERLEAELVLAKAHEKLEVAREKMHADRSEKNIAAYKDACNVVVPIRQAFRAKYQTVLGEGDAAPQVATVAVKAGVHRP